MGPRACQPYISRQPTNALYCRLYSVLAPTTLVPGCPLVLSIRLLRPGPVLVRASLHQAGAALTPPTALQLLAGPARLGGNNQHQQSRTPAYLSLQI